jgi:hypothetical protein
MFAALGVMMYAKVHISHAGIYIQAIKSTFILLTEVTRISIHHCKGYAVQALSFCLVLETQLNARFEIVLKSIFQ